MRSLWRIQPADPPHARALADAAGVDQITAQLLLSRGVTTAEEAARFFRPRLEALRDPHQLPGMARGIARLRQAISHREPILLFSDSDVDGLSASVLLYEALRSAGAAVRAKPSNRIADGYGLPDALVGQLCRSPTKLVILVDCGTNQAEAVRRLAAHRIDTVIVDHHVPLGRWAEPHALINPHAGQTEGRELCSAGLAFKVAQALSDGPGGEPLLSLLDLAALGTLADCSPLVGESRVLVSEGLPRLIPSSRQGLRRLCEATRTITPNPEQVIRWLVPRLNASGRLGDPAAVWHLLRRDVGGQLETWLASAEDAHAKIRQLHRRVYGEAQEQVNRLHFRDQYVVVVSQTGWPQGLMGPLASYLAERYGRPAIAIALNERRGIGSGRSAPRFNLLQTLTRCRELLVEFGGHAAACGLTIDRRHVERFRALVNLRAREAIGREGLLRTRTVDLELPLEAVAPSWVQEVERFAPFGHGNPRPTVAIRRLTVEAVSSRTAWLSDGRRRLRARGGALSKLPAAPYDVVASPGVEEGEVVLMVSELQPSAGPSGPARTSGTLYRRGPA